MCICVTRENTILKLFTANARCLYWRFSHITIHKIQVEQFNHICTILVIYLLYTGAVAATTEFVVAASEVHCHSSLLIF